MASITDRLPSQLSDFRGRELTLTFLFGLFSQVCQREVE
jgi:hypothetical protein